jgi:hypothetical protein
MSTYSCNFKKLNRRVRHYDTVNNNALHTEEVPPSNPQLQENQTEFYGLGTNTSF